MAKLAHYEALVSELMVCNSSCGSEGREREAGECMEWCLLGDERQWWGGS